MTPVKILFVCMGNICRSPAAEGIFNSMVARAGLGDRFRTDSAGTIGYHAGRPADPRMRAAAAKRGYRLDSISRQLQAGDFEEFDHIIAMDLENLEGIEHLRRRNGGNGKAIVSLMCDHARRHDTREVPDPYYGGDKGFEFVLDLLEDACAGLMEDLGKDGR